MTVSCTTPSGFDPLFAVRSTKKEYMCAASERETQ
jgi:hypothetical protein